MRFLASLSYGATSFLLLLLIIPVSLAGYRPSRPQLLHGERRAIEKRSYFDSLGSLFGKRDECSTQFGPTYVDCGYNGCFQPSLGEICCGANGCMFSSHSQSVLFYLLRFLGVEILAFGNLYDFGETEQ